MSADPSATIAQMNKAYHIYTQIHVAFAQSEKLPHLVKLLYLFVRSFDRQAFTKKYHKGQTGKGSGKVVLDIPTLAHTFNRSPETIKKNLRAAKKLGVFWMMEIEGDRVRLVYTAFEKLCQSLGISDLGASYELESTKFEQVRSLNIRYTIARKQRNAQQSAVRSTKERNARFKGRKLAQRVVNPNRIFDAASMLCDRPEKASGVKAIKKICGRFLVVGRQFVPYGVSQETISVLVKRTPQTIRKHLKAIKDLPSVDHYQVCSPTNDAINTPQFWLSHNLGEKHYMRFDGDRYLYVAHTNIYDLEEGAKHLLGCKGLRKRISKSTRAAQRPAFPAGQQA